MKIAHVQHAGQVAWGAVGPDGFLEPLDGVQSHRELFSRPLKTNRALRWGLDEVQWLPPTPHPEKIVCIGKNYEDHAREMGGEPPELPVVFSKFSSALIGSQAPIVLPSISQQVDFEAELVVVIGKSGRHIPRERAMDYVFGYTCGNDVSARDWQKGRPGGQWLLGKTFDSFAPLGPWIVTADELPNPHDLEIELRVNEVVMQQANTRQMIYSIPYLISHLSQFFTWRPGDLIFTGTPAGVGAGRNPPRFLAAGEQVTVRIAGIGELSNPVTTHST